MRKNNSSIIRQTIKAGKESINFQIGSVNIEMQTTENKNIEILIPLEVTDFIYKGTPNTWINVIDLYKSITKKDILTPSELLRLVTTYDISRVRKLEDSKDELLFLDTSWLSHNYNYWNQNMDMKRWLKGLTEISLIRAKKGLKTTRVFFWKPSEIYNRETVFEIMDTINLHLSYGINVYLTEPSDIIHPIDFQVFSKSEGILATDFKKLNLEQANKISDIEMARNLYSLIGKNIDSYKTLKIELNDPLLSIPNRIEDACKINKSH